MTSFQSCFLSNLPKPDLKKHTDHNLDCPQGVFCMSCQVRTERYSIITNSEGYTKRLKTSTIKSENAILFATEMREETSVK